MSNITNIMLINVNSTPKTPSEIASETAIIEKNKQRDQEKIEKTRRHVIKLIIDFLHVNKQTDRTEKVYHLTDGMHSIIGIGTSIYGKDFVMIKDKPLLLKNEKDLEELCIFLYCKSANLEKLQENQYNRKIAIMKGGHILLLLFFYYDSWHGFVNERFSKLC